MIFTMGCANRDSFTLQMTGVNDNYATDYVNKIISQPVKEGHGLSTATKRTI